jgi:hypothetical protein
MTLLGLSDDELKILMSAAAPLEPKARIEFLRAVAAELATHSELGDGLVARVVRELQRRYFDPPKFPNGHGKYD